MVKFDSKNTIINADAKDWQQAIEISAKLLENQGFVTENYVDGIKQGISDFGPYIVIADGLAIPHARPEAGALTTGYGLVTLKDGVKFDGVEQPVKVFIPFCATDSNSHIDLLQSIIQMVENDAIEKLSQIETIEQLEKFMQMVAN